MVSTPGPANLLLMSAGSSHGYLRTFPFLLGLLLGKLFLNILISFGLASLLLSHPLLRDILSYSSAALMIFLALRGWNGGGDSSGSGISYGILVGMIVHPLSPKTWMMSTLAYTQFASDYVTVFDRYALIPLSFLFFQFIFHSLWCYSGSLLSRRLSHNIFLTRSLILLTILVVLWAVFH